MDEGWLEKNVRIVVTSGPYKGRHGRAIKPLSRGEWMVKLDDRMSGTTVKALHLARELP